MSNQGIPVTRRPTTVGNVNNDDFIFDPRGVEYLLLVDFDGCVCCKSLDVFKYTGPFFNKEPVLIEPFIKEDFVD